MELLVKAKFFLKTLTCQTWLTFNVSIKRVNKLCVSNGFILCLKNVLAIPHSFIKMFHLQQRCSPYRTYPELGQGDFYSFDQEKVLFLLIYLLTTHKNHTYLNLVYSNCQRADI